MFFSKSDFDGIHILFHVFRAMKKLLYLISNNSEKNKVTTVAYRSTAIDTKGQKQHLKVCECYHFGDFYFYKKVCKTITTLFRCSKHFSYSLNAEDIFDFEQSFLQEQYTLVYKSDIGTLIRNLILKVTNRIQSPTS